jgi:hypothetical protein
MCTEARLGQFCGFEMLERRNAPPEGLSDYDQPAWLGQMDERILKVEDALGRRMRNPQV